MFEQMLFPTGHTHQGRNTLMAFAGEIGVLAIAGVMMAYFDVVPMPFPQPAIPLYLSPPPAPPPPPAATARRAPVETAKLETPRIFHLPTPPVQQAVPQSAPLAAPPPALADASGAGVVGGIAGGVPGGVLGGALNGLPGALPAPAPVAAAPPKPAPAPTAPEQVRVGGDVQAALLKHEVVPAYPVIARTARIQGTVRLSASIAPNGTVKDLHVVSGNPLLVDAAENAVKQWVYQPTYLNGKPVEVLTEVDVKFSLG